MINIDCALKTNLINNVDYKTVEFYLKIVFVTSLIIKKKTMTIF